LLLLLFLSSLHLCDMSGRPRLVSLVILMAAMIVAAWPAPTLAATQPRLGTALNFAVLAGSSISNTGTSVITGNLGISPGNASSVTGFPPGIVTGAKNTADAVALQAKTDLVTAYNDAATATSTSNLTGQDLGGKNLTPGVYTFTSSAQLTGALTLSGNGVFIFQIGSTLTTASASSVLVAGGAQACAIFWKVGSSATLGLATQFQGNLMALTSITMNTGANILTGRALARNGSLTLDTNQITPPVGACTVAAPPTPTPVASPSPTTTPSPVVSPSPTTTPSPAVSPGPTSTPRAAGSPAPAQVVLLPNTGGPPQPPGFPWLPAAIAGTIGALLLGLRVRSYRRNS
jgi:Ice-binding-like